MSRALKASKRFGSFFWSSGPLFIGSSKLERAAVQREPALLKQLVAKAKADRVVTATLKGETTFLFGVNAPSAWHPSARGGVLVRIHGHANRADWDALVATDPAHVAPEAWKLRAMKLTLRGDAKRFLIDPWAEDVSREPQAVAVTLAAGTYEIDHARLGNERRAVDLYRFRPEGDVVAAATPKGKQVTPPDALVLEPATKKLGAKLKFVQTEGGPVLMLPAALLKSWNGVYDADGEYLFGTEPCDYDRACASKKYVLPVGDGHALVLGQDMQALFVRDPKTAFVLSWIGADHAAHVLQAALSAPEKSFKNTREVFTLRSKTGVALFDSAERGAELKKPFIGKLPAGRWAIDEMKEFDGDVLDGATKHGLMTTAVRLRKV